MNATPAEYIISQLTIIFCVSFIWDIIILHWLDAVPDWFLEPYILWSKLWTVNFNLLKALFNLNSESKMHWWRQYNSQKMYHIAYLIWGADITIFNYLSIERLLINPESSFPEIIIGQDPSVSCAPLFPGPVHR